MRPCCSRTADDHGVATDADVTRLVDSLTELAARRKAEVANVKKHTAALKAEFAKLTAAVDTMRTEIEDTSAEQQCRADSLVRGHAAADK